MPIPDATPVPPPTGVYGLPLKKYGDELREELPDGGYVPFRIEKLKNGTEVWLPQKRVQAAKGIEV